MLERQLVLPHLIAHRARRAADAECLQDVTGPWATAAGLSRDLLDWAGMLRELGVEAGDRIVNLQPHRLSGYASWLGIAWLRAIEVPVNTGYRGAMLRYLISNSGARVLIVAECFLDRLVEIADQLDGPLTVVVPDPSAPLP